MNTKQKSGILAHITSLPGQWGLGEIGPQARAFGEQLAAGGQKMWQILPTGPVGYGYSPYASDSAFAGNPLLISFDDLIADGLLSEGELAGFPEFDQHTIEFPAVIEARMEILNRVGDRFVTTEDFIAFCEREAYWLNDYCLFASIREAQENRSWMEWPEGLRDRDFQCLENARADAALVIRRHQVLQYIFSKQWKRLKDFFQGLDIEIVGDVPIFVAGDSVDVWANRDLFYLNTDGTPTVVAGVPPDYFSETGQRWGNPLYDWAAHRASAYKWWTERMQRMFEMVDTVRIDHFRGFEACWEIAADEPTAIKGRWVKGSGIDLFQTLEKNLRKRPEFGNDFKLADHVIAENLGVITDAVETLREDCGFPGMWILQFRFGALDMSKVGTVPEGVEINWSVYTGTHDNDTVCGWFNQLPAHLPPGATGEFDFEQQCILDYLNSDGSQIHLDFVRLALRSPADRAILALQDLMGLGSETRMNTPGTTESNWRWRFTADMLPDETLAWLREQTEKSGRV